MPKCAAIKSNGERCERIIGAAQQFCYSHDPARSSERKANASKAARSRVGGELPTIKKDLRKLADDVLKGEVDKSRAAVAAQLYGVLLRAFQVEFKQKELEEFESRLEALETGRAWR